MLFIASYIMKTLLPHISGSPQYFGKRFIQIPGGKYLNFTLHNEYTVREYATGLLPKVQEEGRAKESNRDSA